MSVTDFFFGFLQVVESVPTLPEIPLPAIQPNYRPLPSIDVTPLSPQRRKGKGPLLAFKLGYLFVLFKLIIKNLPELTFWNIFIVFYLALCGVD